MNKVLRLTLSQPPSVNHMYWQHPHSNVRIKTKEAKKWYEETKEIARKACKKQGWQCTPRGTKLVMDILTVYKDHRKRDCHNNCKAELDSLEGIVYDNDCDVYPRYIETRVDKENPRVDVVIRVFDANTDGWKYKETEDDT